MAGPCIEYKGKQYTYAEFATLLHDGELANLANNGILKGFENIPEELKSKNETASPTNTSDNDNKIYQETKYNWKTGKKETADLIVFHGTGDKFDSFNSEKYSGTTRYGKGISFTDGEGIANRYSLERQGLEDSAENDNKAIVKKAKLTIKKPFDERRGIDINTSEAKKLISILVDKYGLNKQLVENILEAKTKDSPFTGISKAVFNPKTDTKTFMFSGDTEKTRKIIEDAGYDSIIGEYEDANEYFVFSPKNIISNETTPSQDTSANGNVQPRVGIVDKNAEQQNGKAENLPSAVEREKSEGIAESKPIKKETSPEVNFEEIADFLNTNFIESKQKEVKASKTEVKETPKIKEVAKKAEGFVSLAINKVTKSLKDFQGRAKEYSQQTYDRIVNEAKEGTLNISSIPPIQVWINEKGENLILAGHSRVKAFEDLASGNLEINNKYNPNDFKKINTQIVEAESLEEAQKIARESNQGAVQTVVDNAKYVRENLMPTSKSFNALKTKMQNLYGSSWARIYAFANLNPKGKAMQMLKQFQESNEGVSDDVSKKVAEWTGKARSDFNNLTDAHENEIFDYLIKNTKIKTYAEFYEILNNRVNSIVNKFNQNEPLNFEYKTGVGSNEIEYVKAIEDVEREQVALRRQIKDVQKRKVLNLEEKNRRNQEVSELTKKILSNEDKLTELGKKRKQAREADANQFDIFSQINNEIENGNITSEQVDKFIDNDRKAKEIEPIVKTIESRSESKNKAELNELLQVIENEIGRESTDRRTNRKLPKYEGKSVKQQQNERPQIIVQAESSMPLTKDHLSQEYEIDDVQKQGVNTALDLFEKGGKSFLLADGTGVGKTRQILVLAKEYANKFGGKVLIISENNTILTKNFTNDAKALGIDMNEFEFATYNDLRTGKKGKGEYGLVIYDEAHNLKNQESGKSIAAGNIKTKNNMYVTATPMDTIASSVYFISEVSGVTEDQAYNMLGLKVEKQVNPVTKEVVKIVTLQQGVAPIDIKRNIIRIREEIIAKGAMLRREYPFYGEFIEDDIELSESQLEEQAEIEDSWDERIEMESISDDGRVNIRKKMNLSGQKSGELSRWSESTKIKYTFNEVVKEIKKGNKVVVIAEGVNETTITAIDKVVPGLLTKLSKMLQKEGYSVAEIYGKSNKAEANDKFQNNEVDVVLGTAKSASTGIDLDDQTGTAPRVLFMVTPNYSGNVFQQILGRVSRRNTKSPATVRLLFNQSNIDARRKQIVNGKLQTLKAIQEGVIDDEIEIDIQETQPETTFDAKNILIEDISDKAFVVKGDTKPIKDQIKEAGGRYNPKYGGWIFPKTKKESVKSLISKLATEQAKAERKEAINEQVDKLFDKIKKALPKGGDGTENIQGISQDQLIDLVADAVKALISKGIDINDAIRQVISSIKDRFNVDVDENLVKEKLGIEKPQDFESKPGKKSVLNRMASGNSAEIKKAISKYSLDYEIENQKEAKSKAEMFVDEVGVDNALIAVRKGLIEGAQGAFIYAKAIEVLEQEINALKGDDKLDAIADYQELLGQISDELDNRSRNNGRFIAALSEIYNSSGGRYNLTKMVNDYKAQNNGVISKEVLEKLKNVEEKLKESEAKLADLEAKKRIEEENEAFNNILESVARKKRINTNAKITDKQKAKAFADKLRSFKISNNANLSAATPFSIAYDLAIETAAQALEVSGIISDAIKAGVNSIRNSKLSKEEQEQALSDLFDLFDDSDVNTGQKGVMSIDQNGKLRIPHSLIREKVESGIDNIDDLVSELMSDAKELFPDLNFTERQIRDIVTGYGKISNPTLDEIETQISIMKSLGKIASGLEDANKGQRPLRSGQQRREPTIKERTEMKKLKALLRDLPLADADVKKAYKTALEAIKKRLSNEIEELDEQIANGEKRKGQKSVIEYDQEAKDLKAERDAKKTLLDEMVGKPELTEQQKIDRAEKTLQKRLDDLQQKINSGEIDYAKKAEPVTSDKLEEMRKLKKEYESQIQKMREDSGLAETRLIEIAKRNASKRLASLKERIANNDFEKKKRKPTPTDVELNKIKSEIAEQKEIFDKEVYKLELKNRRWEQKAFDTLKDILSIPKILSFTSDLSFVGIQPVTQIYKMGANSLISLAKTGRLKGTFRDAMTKTFKAMASPSFEQKFMQAVKANPNYQLWKDSKLGIVESHYKESAKAEVFQHNALSTLFDILGNYVASKGYEKTGDVIKNYINIISIFERGQTVFENQMRINRFQEGVDLLKAQGLNPIDDIQEYRKVAAAVNTLTGRANTGSKVAAALREANGTLFSSFSNWAAGVNQLNPYWYYTLTPTARKMALTDVAHHIIGAGSLISLAALYGLGQDDDDKDKVTVETDPTSSDFAVIKIGNLRIDPWAGKKTTVVAFARLRYGHKKDKYGNFKEYGTEYDDEDWIKLPIDYVGNKFAPGPRFALERFFGTKEVEYKGNKFREDEYGTDFKTSKYLIPLIFENFKEVNEEQPNLFGKAIMALSWTGLINTNVYGGFREGLKDMPDDLIEKEYKVKIQKIKDNEKILESNIDKLAKSYNEKKINKNQILQKVDSLTDGDPELFNKTIKTIIQKVNKEELKTLVDDPFYLGLKKEKNPEIQAILFYAKFKDDSKMSEKDKKERDKNLRYIEFDFSNPKFLKAYRELRNNKKPIN